LRYSAQLKKSNANNPEKSGRFFGPEKEAFYE
jgi:hypothetical protein